MSRSKVRRIGCFDRPGTAGIFANFPGVIAARIGEYLVWKVRGQRERENLEIIARAKGARPPKVSANVPERFPAKEAEKQEKRVCESVSLGVQG